MAKTIGKLSRMEIFRYILLFLYFLSISAFRLGEGFDAAFVRVIFVAIMFFSIFRKKKMIIYGIFVWAVIFWVFYFLSALWASNASDTLSNVALAIQILGLFIFIPTYITDKKSMNIVLKLLLCSLVCTAFILLAKTPLSDFGTVRLGEAIGLNPNAFGLRMAIGAIIALYLFHIEDKTNKFHRILFLVTILVLFGFALLSGSKKALVAIILGLIGCELLLAKGIKVVMKIIGISLAIFALFVLIFSNQQFYDIIGFRLEKTFYTLTDQASSKYTDRSLEERRFYIERAINLFKRYPIAGYGGNNFRTYMGEINYSHVAYSHNNYVELLSTLGIIGFFIYYSLWVVALYWLIKIFLYEKKKDGCSPATVLFLTMLVILLVLDYGMVGYCSEFNMLVFCLIYLYAWSRKKTIVKIQSEREKYAIES